MNFIVCAGPIGRNIEAGGAVVNFAPIFSYRYATILKNTSNIFICSKSKGLFAGMSLEGSLVFERKKANAKFYGISVNAKEILSGAISPPDEAQKLYDALDEKISPYPYEYHKNDDSISDIQIDSSPVRIQRNIPPPINRIPPLPNRGNKPCYATALFDFDAADRNDLSFKKGDVVLVTYKTDSDFDWWKGTVNGVVGQVLLNLGL